MCGDPTASTFSAPPPEELQTALTAVSSESTTSTSTSSITTTPSTASGAATSSSTTLASDSNLNTGESENTDTNNSSSGIGAGAIAGITFGGLAVIALVGLGAFWLYLRQQRRHRSEEPQMLPKENPKEMNIAELQNDSRLPPSELQ